MDVAVLIDVLDDDANLVDVTGMRCA